MQNLGLKMLLSGQKIADTQFLHISVPRRVRALKRQQAGQACDVPVLTGKLYGYMC